MKKRLLLFTFLLFSLVVIAQINISGVVYDQNKNPLEGVAVYLDNTAIGTTTNARGAFSLKVASDEYNLVVSHMGFHSQSIQLSTRTNFQSIIFRLKEKSDVLDEIVIENRKRLTLDEKKDFLRLFQREFIGTSKVAERCRILNKEVLEYNFDARTQNLNITASAPLQISNPSLGYILHYDLHVFQLTSGIVYYAGHMRFEEVEASKKKKRRLHKNRRRAYHGSLMHFLRSIVDGNMQYQGFEVHHIRRILNEPQAYEESLKNAQEYEYRQEMIKANVLPSEYSRFKNDARILQFKDHLQISYKHESLDENYPSRDEFRYQISTLSLDANEVEILNAGVLKKPLDAFVLGYWSFEKVGDTVPLDFKP